MVEVSGLAVKTVPLFIKENFGEEGLEKWISGLDPEIAGIYSNSITISQWFDIQKIFVEPIKILCELFYDGDEHAAWQLGRFSASYGLKGVLKVFVKMGSVNFLVRRASVIIPNYYTPMTMEVDKNEKGYAVLQIPEFENMHALVENRIGGWMESALEICGAKELTVNITKSLAGGDDITEYQVRWA